MTLSRAQSSCSYVSAAQLGYYAIRPETGRPRVTTAATETAPTTRLSSLDALRGVASFSVVLCHYYLTIPAETRPLLDPSIWLRPLHVIMNGAAAVIIFFFLSGYVLSLPFFRGTQPSYPRYLFKRVCRIYIPFAVMIFITALLSRILDFHEPLVGVGVWLNEQMPRVTSTALAGHFLMIGTRSDISLNPPIWTLVYEMRVSLIFPLLMILCRDTRLALVSAAIMLLVSTRILVHLGETAPWTVNSFWITVLWTVRVVPYFLLGILLSKHSDNIRRFTHRVSPQPASHSWQCASSFSVSEIGASCPFAGTFFMTSVRQSPLCWRLTCPRLPPCLIAPCCNGSDGFPTACI